MKTLQLILLGIFLCISQTSYAEKEKIPPKGYWEESSDRTNDSPQLFQDDSYIYIYSEKQLDNLYIGITDMQGQVFYEETTVVPAGQYYAIPIDSLPNGSYYISIIQGSNYVIGIFTK